MNDSRSGELVNEADVQTLRTLASIAAFKNWRQMGMPRRIAMWIRTAGRQELMTAVAAGLQRLNRHKTRAKP